MKKIIIVLIVLLIGCTPKVYCSPLEVNTATKEMKSNGSRFQDEINIATTTPRIRLLPVIETLQSIRNDANNIIVPECLSKQKQYLVESYDSAINAYTKFLGGEKADMSQFNLSMQKLLDEMNRLNACLPNCQP